MTFVAGQKVRASELNAGQPAYARVASAVTVISSTAFVNVTGLVLPVEASSFYALDGYIEYTSATGSDIKFCLIGPASAGGTWGAHGLAQAAAASTGDLEAFALDGIGSGNALGLGGAGVATSTWGHLKGLITTGATAGTLQLQFAQVASVATNTVVRAGSHLSLVKIA